MQITLKFLGATQNVTGSRFLVELDGRRVLIDCGLYQERPFLERNWAPFDVPPDSIDAVLLTHAHLDHCGLLPKLLREGFRGRIYCTAATADIARIILLDAAHLQEEDAAYKRKRHQREGRTKSRPPEPLYTIADAEKTFPHFSPVGYRRPVKIAKGIDAIFHDAGHVFGSSSISLRLERNGQARTILFSGDVGRQDMPILEDPDLFDQADYVLIESTYGDRIHEPSEDVENRLAEIISETFDRGGNIAIPSFALERAQNLLYYLNELHLQKRLGPIKVFLDSPMAIRVTEVFKNHPEFYDEEMRQRIGQELSPFSFPGLTMTMTTDESKAINRIRQGAMIIAGSGMCTGGRIKHHLANNISRPECTVLFVGYQANGTLGRHIVNGAEEVRIFGQMRQIKAKIERIGGFSAHADQQELLHWLSGLKKAPRNVFVVHGESESADAFAQHIHQAKGWNASVPAYRDTIDLE